MKFYSTLIIAIAFALASCSNGDSNADTSSEVAISQSQIELIIPDGLYSLVKEEPSIIWAAKKLNGSGHSGTISASNGKMKVEGGEITSGMLTLDMNTFTCTDLEGEDKEGFDSHLKSEDFLDVEKYPNADVKIDGLKTINGELVASIKLRLHGGTVSYTTPLKIKEVEFENGHKGYQIAGVLIVDRTKHKIIYGSGSFFDNLGDRAIKDEVSISFSFTAV